jgi:hypothetical protein
MDNVDEIVALLRRQADLENQILNDHGTAAATEWELAATRRRLVAYPQGAERRPSDRACLASHAGHRLGAGRDGFRGFELGPRAVEGCYTDLFGVPDA